MNNNLLTYSFNISNLSLNLNNEDINTITIFFGDGKFININKIPQNNIIHQYKNVGRYTIVILIYVKNGKYITNMMKINIPSYIPMPIITGDQQILCNSNSTIIDLTASVDNNSLIEGQKIIKYEWKLNDEIIAETQNLHYEFRSNCSQDLTLDFYCRVYDNIGNVSDWSIFTVEVKK